jgi:hypothetical protein
LSALQTLVARETQGCDGAFSTLLPKRSNVYIFSPMAKRPNPDQAIAVGLSADAGNQSAPAQRLSSQPFRKRAGAPLHHQIKEDLFHNLRSGDWPPG